MPSPDDEADSERPTVIPKYDVENFAREAGAPSAPYRQQMATMTDPVELEVARVASTFTSPPPAIEVSAVEVSEDVVLAGYEARFGSLARIPRIAVSSATLASLTLDHRAGFVLALVDGVMTIENILDVGGMPAPDTLAILQDLVDRGIVTLA